MKISSSARPLFAASASLEVKVSTPQRPLDSFRARLNRDGFDRSAPRQDLANIEQRIKAGVKDGSLSPREAAQLQAKADGLRNALKDGASPRELRQLEGLSREVRRERHDAQKGPSLEDRKAGFTERITEGLADGSLTGAEARRLSQRLENLGPNPDPKAVDQLSRAIFAQRHDAQGDGRSK